jgi:hypothetical protein
MKSRHRQLELEASVWEAALPLREARRHQREARHYRLELERRRTDFAPLLEQLRAAARSYAAALTHRAQELRRAERDQREERARWSREEEQGRGEAARAGAGAAAASQRLADVLARLREADGERRRLEGRGTLRSAEEVAAAVRRLEAEAVELRARLAALDDDRTRNRGEAETAEGKIRAAEREGASARTALEAAVRVRDEAEARRRALERDPVLLEELELAEADLEKLPDAAIERLDEAARRRVDAVVRLKLERAGDERALRHLETKGLLPPSADAEQILEALQSRLPAAWSGWEYLSRTVPGGERASVIARLPEVAAGVVVRDEDLEKAREILAGADVHLQTELPVVVAPLAALASDRQPAGVVVGPGSAALYDRAAAEGERGRRRERAEQLSRDIASEEQRRAQVEALVGRLRAFRVQHPRGWFAEQAARLEDGRRVVDEAEALRTTALERAEALKKERAEIDRGFAEADRALRVVERHATELEAYQRQHEAGRAALAAERDELEPKIAQLRGDEQAQRRRADESAAHARAAEEAARRLAEDAIAIEHERRSVRHVQDEATAEPGPIADLRDEYGRLHALYDKEVGAEWLAHAAEQAEQKLALERERLRKLLREDVTEAKAAAALDSLPQPDDADSRWREAVRAAASALGQVGNQTQVLQRRTDEVRAAEQACVHLGVPCELPDPRPAGPSQAEVEAELADKEAARAQGEAAEEEAKAARAAARRQDCEHVAETLGRDARRLEALTDRYAEIVVLADMARFSGGEQLTSAILLYCTLAQLRARNRGLGRSPSSVLVLDNPIGRASRARFLELQREVARAMGVQLIYTTGVNDFEALHVLPNVIRLRNERMDRNTGQQLVEHEAEVSAARVGRDERPQPPEGAS